MNLAFLVAAVSLVCLIVSLIISDRDRSPLTILLIITALYVLYATTSSPMDSEAQDESQLRGPIVGAERK